MKHLSTDELSAYIDGESREPAAVAGHLRSCAECARRHAELAKLSAQIRGLRSLEAPSGFAGHVLARVREVRPAGASPWRWAGPVLAAAAIALVTAAVFLRDRGEVAPGPRMATPGVPVDVDTERLMNEVAERIALGEDPGYLEDVGPLGGEETEEATGIDEEVLALAQAGWLDELSNELDAEEDVDSLLASLSPAEAEMFRRMLVQYGNEG
jgi:hypothetical protein